MPKLVAPFKFGSLILWAEPKHACGAPPVVSYDEGWAPFVKVDFGGV